MFIVIADNTVNTGFIIIIFKRLHSGFIFILDSMKVLQTLNQSRIILLQ